MKCTIISRTATLAVLFTIFSISAIAQEKFVYTNNDRQNNNSVTGFKIKADGRLEILPGMPVQTGSDGGEPLGTLVSIEKIVVTEKGPYLFVSNDGDQTITSFKIDPETGALTFIEIEDIGGGGNEEGISLTVSPNEQFLYAANPNHDRIHALRIFDDGTLAEIGVAQLGEGNHPLEMQVSPNGEFLAVTIFQGNIDLEGRLAMFKIGEIGQLEPVPGSPFKGSDAGRIGNALFNCEGNLLFVAKEFTSIIAIDVFSISQNGVPSLIDGAPFVFNIDATVNQIAMSPNGRFLFVNNRLNEINVLKIKTGGQLELIVFPTYTTNNESEITDMVIDPEGKFLFACFSDQRLEPLIIAPNGQLSDIEDSLVGTNEDNGVGQSGLDSFVAFPLPKKCQIKVPDDIDINNAQFECGNTVDYPSVTTCGDDCGPVTCNPPSGAFFAVGTHTVNCSAQGADDAQFTITVNDIDSPKIACPNDITVSTDPGKCSAIVNYTFNVTDFCDDNPQIEIDFPPGTEFPKGTTTVHIKATDKAGNFSNCVFTVKVVDQQAPVLNCKADITVNNEPNKCGSAVNYELPSVSDNCPGVAAPLCNPPSGSLFPIGQTLVTCAAKDAADNQGQCSFKVEVKDIQPPSILCTDDMTVVTANPCDAGVMVNYPLPEVSDNCPNNLNLVCNPPPNSVLPVGSVNVICTVTDGGGNKAQCSFKITVFDVRLQDDSNQNAVILFNSFTGDYRICSPSLPQSVTGKGTIIKQGCVSTLQHNSGDRKLLAKVDPAIKKGSATLQMPPGILKVSIIDKDITNNTTICP